MSNRFLKLTINTVVLAVVGVVTFQIGSRFMDTSGIDNV